MSTYCVQDICLSININSNRYFYSFIFHLNYGFYLPLAMHYALLPTRDCFWYVLCCVCVCMCKYMCDGYETGLGMILLGFFLKAPGHTDYS